MSGQSITIYTAGTLGDHLPVFWLGKALSARGYHVRMAVNSSMADYALGTGLEVIKLTNLEGGEEEARLNAGAWNFLKPNAKAGVSSEQEQDLLEKTCQQCKELLLCCRESDLLISTTIRPQGYLAANCSGVPWISISMNPNAYIQPSNPDENKTYLHFLRKEFEQNITGLMGIMRSLGTQFPVPPYTRAWLWAPLVILASSPDFMKHDTSLLLPQAELVQTGFLYYEDPAWESWQPDEELREFCEVENLSDRPIVLAFSSQPLEDPVSVLQTHARAASLLRKRLLVQKGWAGFCREMLPDDVDPSQVLIRDFLPHDWLFAHASCTIQHGGIGSIARAIRQACPMLLEPYGNDQFYNANRVHELGIGAVLNPLLTTPEKVANVLSKLITSPRVRERITSLAQDLEAENGTENACQVIEAYLGTQQFKSHHWKYPPLYEEFQVQKQLMHG